MPAASLRERLSWDGCFLLPAMLIVAPATWHNYRLERQFVMVSANGGINFYIGNNPRADGIYGNAQGFSPAVEHQFEECRSLAEKAEGRVLTRGEVSAYWFRQGAAFIRQDLRRYLRLEGLKLKRLVSGIEYSNMYYLSFERKRFTPLLWLFPLGFALLLPLAAAGAVCLLREWRKYALVGIVILVTVLNMLIFFVDERFRLPLAPFLIFIAAVGLVKGARLMADRSQWIVRRGALGLLMVLAAGLTWGAERLDPGRSSIDYCLYLFLGDIHFDRGDYRQALDAYYTSSRLTSNNWASAMEVSKVLLAMGKKDIALNLYRQALPNLSAEIAPLYRQDKDFAALRDLDATNSPMRGH